MRWNQRLAAILLLVLAAGCEGTGPQLLGHEEKGPTARTRQRAGAPSPSLKLAGVAGDVCPPDPNPQRVTHLVYVGQSRVVYGESLTLAGLLTDEAGQPLTQQTVRFQLASQTFSAQTDANGVAKVALTPTRSPGALDLTADYEGDAAFTAAHASAVIDLVRAPSLLHLATPGTMGIGVPLQVTATLTDVHKAPIPGRTVTFEVAGVTVTGTTTQAGVATASLTVASDWPTGTGVVKASFAGDAFFTPSSQQIGVTLYLPTAFAIWGGNPAKPKLGDHVNFWGHSWPKQVVSGDYAAQGDFKGYAETLSAFRVCQPAARTNGSPKLEPGCWSSKTGQSFPPATLPELIGVLITDSVAKDKGTLYGNVAALALLRVDATPPYGPDPGKPGYGTLVAVIDPGTLFPQPARLEATQSQPATALPGATFDVAVAVHNPATALATEVVVDEHFDGTAPGAATAPLNALPPGGQANATFHQSVAALPTRQADEPTADYQTRLASSDGRPLTSIGLVSFVDPSGQATAPVDLFSATRLELPRLTLAMAGPRCVAPGETVTFTVSVANIGSAGAAAPRVTLTFADGTQTVVTFGAVAPGASDAKTAQWTVPAVSPKGADESNAAYVTRLQAVDGTELITGATLEWKDGAGSSYGTILGQLSSTERVPILTVAAGGLSSLLPAQQSPLKFDVANVGTGIAANTTIRVSSIDGKTFASAPFTLAGGQTTAVSVSVQAPAVAPKSASESDAAYQARLLAVDEQPLPFPYGLEWEDPIGGHYGAQTGTAQSLEVLPVASLSLSGPETARPGDTLVYNLTYENHGHAAASGLALTATLPDGSTQSISVPTSSLPPTASGQVSFTFPLPPNHPAGTVETRASFRWSDAASNAYGPLEARAETKITEPNRPPVVSAGPDQTLTLPATATLAGTASDDGLPAGAGLTTSWVQVSGPGTAAFVDRERTDTGVEFSLPGTYVLRLTASDSQLSASDEMTATVLPPAGSGITYPGSGSPGETTTNVVHEGRQLQLSNTANAFNFIWVAVSTKGTVVKINTDTGAILGEYWIAPQNVSKDPSRTTVDHNGSVWATNRAGNSVLRIGLVENGQCVDRNHNGVIDTSHGQNDVKTWLNANGADTNGGVSTALDECIINYTRVSASGTRHVAVDVNNDVWVSGTGGRQFDLLDGVTGQIKRHENSVGYGGYGGLIDGNGVIWSANPLLRWDTAFPLNGPNGGNWTGYGHNSYGLCRDSHGNVWNTSLSGGQIRKFSPSGALLGTYGHGSASAQGCVVDRNDDVWVAHVLWGTADVGHLKNDGTFVGNVPVPSGPTGVAMDAKGKIWATNYNTRNVSRIDPNAGPIGKDGKTHVGAVDLTTVDIGGNPYNYSDMTGSTLLGAPDNGTWAVVFDSAEASAPWGHAAWRSQVCGNGSLTVTAASSNDGTAFSPPAAALNGGALTGLPNGRYLRVEVGFHRSSKDDSPRLYDFTVGTADYVIPPRLNEAPQVDAGPSRSVTWGDPVRLTGSACDDGLPAGHALAISWTKLSGPGDVQFTNPDQEVTDATFSATGLYVLRLTVTDSEFTKSGDVSLNILPRNLPPTVAAGAPVGVTLPATASLSGTATDDGLPAGSALTTTWTKVSGPGTVTFGDPSQASTTASFSAAGTYVLRLTASDSQLTSRADVTVVANVAPPVNRPPSVSAGANQSTTAGTPVTLRGTVTDDGLPSGAPVTISWTQVSGPAPVGFSAPGAAVTNATFSATGTYVLRLTATDTVLSASSDVAVAVGAPVPVNAPPVVNAGPNLGVTLPADAALAGTATDDGLPAGSTLSLTWSKVSGPGAVTFANPAQAATSAHFTVAGTYVLRLSATDSQASASADTTVVVTAAPGTNQAPVVSAGLGTTVSLPTRTVSLAGTATDDGLPAGSTLTVTWSQVSGPAGASFGSPNKAATTFTVTNAGTYLLRLTATDSVLTSSSDVVVTVSSSAPVNAAPVVSAGPDQTISFPSRTAILAGTVSDDGLPAGSTLQAWWSQVSGPGDVTFAAAPGAVTATFSTFGDYLLRLTATDSELTSSSVVLIHVLPDLTNHPPQVSAGPAQVFLLPGPAILGGGATDDGLPASGTLTFAWSKVGGPGDVAFADPAQVVTTATFSMPGTYVLRLTANDSQLSASADMSIEAQSPGILEKGFAYLLAQQGPEGAFGQAKGEAVGVVTPEAVQALRAAGRGDTDPARRGELYLSLQPAGVDSEPTLRRALALMGTPYEGPVPVLRGTALGFDGGDPLHLALTLQALPASALGSAAAPNGPLAALLGFQRASGCFGAADNPDSVDLTAEALMALRRWSFVPGAVSASQRAGSCLAAAQRSDGSFGSVGATVSALLAWLFMPDASPDAVNAARQALVGAQHSNGSWEESVRITGRALHALRGAAPDWQVITDAQGAGLLTLSNASVPRGTPVDASLDVRNASATAAGATVVRFFAEPAGGGAAIAVCEAPLPALVPGGQTAVTCSLDTAALQGSYRIRARVNPLDATLELDERNNDATASLGVGLASASLAAPPLSLIHR